MAAPLTAEQLKERERESWSGAAPSWRREDSWLIENLHVVTEKMVELGGIAEGHRVLDLACGTGEPALHIASVVGRRGSVLATDLSEAMLSFAREKAELRQLSNVELRVADGETLPGVAGPFDAVTIRFGIMFMPDPVGCARTAHRLLAAGGRLVVATWGPPSRNPFLSTVLSVLQRRAEVAVPPPGAPGIFAFADEARLQSVLEAAGFVDPQIAGLAFAIRYRDPAHYFDFQTQRSAPIRDALSKLAAEARAAVRDEAMQEIARFQGPDGLSVPAFAWLAMARR